MSDLYRFEERPAKPSAPLLILLHGTGGAPHQLIAMGADLMPEAHLVAPEGDVLEHGAPRFFKRTGEGVYDMADLARATHKMQAFIRHRTEAARPSSVSVLGYSNGANILASVLFAPNAGVDRAVLMHPLIPFEAQPQPGLAGLPILITAGRRDPIAPAVFTERLATYFDGQGADARLVWHEGGHELRLEELQAVRSFLEDVPPRVRRADPPSRDAGQTARLRRNIPV
jgi:phospholipase/carboxylesterase